MTILESLKNGRLIADGGMGTMLQSMGLRPGRSPEAWNIEMPENVAAVHRAYIEAGSRLITTNTFGANRIRQRRTRYPIEELAKAGVSVARKEAEACPEPCYVALDVGPLGAFLEPLGDISYPEAVELFSESIRAAGDQADCILIETMGDCTEAAAAIEAARSHSSLPVFVTFSFDQNKRLLSGESVETVLEKMLPLGISAIGCNCGLGPEEMLSLVPVFTEKAGIPLIFQPNAGLPQLIDGKSCYTLGPENFAKTMQKVAALGGNVFGGCCGTNPDYIRALKNSL